MAATEQLELFVPARLPRRPYCTDDLSCGLRIRDLKRALECRYIQINPPHLAFWLPFDQDHPGGAFAWESANLAAPNAALITPENAHAHLLYALTAPVLTSDAAHAAPLRYLAAIEHAYREELGADPGYAGFLVKTPNHAAWKTCYGPLVGYSLGELAEYVPNLPKRIPQRARAAELARQGFGRNVSIFRALGPDGKLAVGWLHRHATATFEEFQETVRDYAQTLNAAFATPLPGNELRHIMKSVAKYTWQRWETARRVFVTRQAARGRRGGMAVGNQSVAGVASGKARAEIAATRKARALVLRASGMAWREVGESLGISETAARLLCSR